MNPAVHALINLTIGLLIAGLSLPLIRRKVPMNKTYGIRFRESPRLGCILTSIPSPLYCIGMKKIFRRAGVAPAIICFSLFTALPQRAEARVTVSFGTASIFVNQRAGAIQIPVNFSGDPTGTFSEFSSMAWYSQSGSASYRSHFYHGTDLYGGNEVRYYPGDPRTKFLTMSIVFTESVIDRTFTVVLDPSDTNWPFRTSDANAGSPAFVTVTVLGVSPQYLLLKNSIQSVTRQIKRASKIRDAGTRAKKMRALSRKKLVLQAKLNRTI